MKLVLLEYSIAGHRGRDKERNEKRRGRGLMKGIEVNLFCMCNTKGVFFKKITLR